MHDMTILVSFFMECRNMFILDQFQYYILFSVAAASDGLHGVYQHFFFFDFFLL